MAGTRGSSENHAHELPASTSISRNSELPDRCRDCVSIVIPTFNSEKYIKDCVESILNQDLENIHIFVVDNNSTDATRRILNTTFPGVHLVCTERNLGYAGGCNLGFTYTHSRFVGFVNADCTLTEQCISELLACLVANPNLGAVMPKICMKQSPLLINTDGNQLQYLGFAACGNLNRDSALSEGVATVPYPSGAMVLVTKEAFEAVQGFDPEFFMYHEDVDLGLRLRLMGYEVACDRKALAYHDYEPWRNQSKLYYYERNRFATLLKVYSWRSLAILTPAIAAAELGVFWESAKGHWLGTKCRSYIDFLAMIPSIFPKRRLIQATRKISDPELFVHLTSTFESPLVENQRGLSALGLLLTVMKPLLISKPRPRPRRASPSR